MRKGRKLSSFGNRKGLSGVVTALILIGLSLIAIGIVWVVVNTLISSSSEQIDVNKFTVNLGVKSAVMTPNGLEVVVKRDPGTGDISNIALVVSDGTKKETFLLNETLAELQERKFTLAYSGIVKSVDAVPFLGGKSDSASGVMGSPGTLAFSPAQTIKNMPGLVSWYRFEGNAEDEMKRNRGSIVGSPQVVDGKFGKAYNFTSGKYINIPDSASLRLENSNMSIVAWVYANEITSTNELAVLLKGNATANTQGHGYALTLIPSLDEFSQPDGSFFARYYTNRMKVFSTKNESESKFVHVSGTMNILGSNALRKIYIEGVLNGTINPSFTTGTTEGKDLSIGYDYYTPNPFDGIIDEVMIFNRTLSADEIKGIYTLDLG